MATNPWDYYVKNGYYIILDTCALMERGFTEKLLGELVESLTAYGKKVCFPSKVRNEIRYHLGNPEKEAAAKNAWHIKDTLEIKNLIIEDDMGEERPEERFADPAIKAIIEREMVYKKILLVSQDRNLTEESLAKNKSESTRPKGIVVAKIGRDGYLNFQSQSGGSRNPDDRREDDNRRDDRRRDDDYRRDDDRRRDDYRRDGDSYRNDPPVEREPYRPEPSRERDYNAPRSFADLYRPDPRSGRDPYAPDTRRYDDPYRNDPRRAPDPAPQPPAPQPPAPQPPAPQPPAPQPPAPEPAPRKRHYQGNYVPLTDNEPKKPDSVVVPPAPVVEKPKNSVTYTDDQTIFYATIELKGGEIVYRPFQKDPFLSFVLFVESCESFSIRAFAQGAAGEIPINAYINRDSEVFIKLSDLAQKDTLTVTVEGKYKVGFGKYKGFVKTISMKI